MARLGDRIRSVGSDLGIARAGLIRYGANTLWMLLERGAGLLFALAGSILLARHLGAERFGLLQYALSFCAMFGLVGGLGLDSLVVREIVRDSTRTGVLLGTTAVLRLAAAVLAVCIIAAASWAAGHGELLAGMILLVSIALLASPTTVVEFHFQAQVRARLPSLVRVAAALATLGFVAAGVTGQAGPAYFSAFPLLEAAIIAAGLGLVWILRADRKASSWRFESRVAGSLLREAWPLALSFALIAIYANLDKLLVRTLLGDGALGVYATASKLTEALFYIPTIIVSSLFPAVVRARDSDPAHYRRRMQQLYDLMVYSGVVVALPLALFSEQVVALLYGGEYVEAANILVIQMASFTVVAVAVAMGRWMILEGRPGLFLLRSVIGVAANASLNWMLIPHLGLVGAALAGGISHILVLLAPIAVDAGGRDQVRMALRSLVFASAVKRVLETGR